MKVHIIGMGRISQKHISAFKENNLLLTSVVDIDKNALITDGTYKSFADYRQLSIPSGIHQEIAIVSTSTDSHFEISFFLLESGFNVIIEKPVALSLTQIDLLISKESQAKGIVSVCHQNRFNISVQRLYHSLQRRKLGKLFYGVAVIRWNRTRAYYDQADWRGKWKSDGGALMNQSIHNIDLLLWMMGSPVVEVFGYIDNKNHPSIEVEDMGVALLKFENGSFGIIESSMNTYPENFEETLSIFGEKGTVVLGGKSVNKIVHWNVKDDPIDDLEKFNEEVDSVYGNGHIALYKDFIAAIEQDREPAITLQDGRNAVEVILAIYLSSFEKRPVQLPLPASTSTVMFEERNFAK
jgi:UDP-N-acetyl-2-amino-2-deoxyglucuronate dehydrogenase